MDENPQGHLDPDDSLRFVYDALERMDRLLSAAATPRPSSPTTPELTGEDLEDDMVQLLAPTAAALHASGVYSDLLALVAGLAPAEIESIGYIGWEAEDHGSSCEPSVRSFLSEVPRLNQRVSDDVSTLALELAARRRRDDERTEQRSNARRTAVGIWLRRNVLGLLPTPQGYERTRRSGPFPAPREASST